MNCKPLVGGVLVLAGSVCWPPQSQAEFKVANRRGGFPARPKVQKKYCQLIFTGWTQFCFGCHAVRKVNGAAFLPTWPSDKDFRPSSWPKKVGQRALTLRKHLLVLLALWVVPRRLIWYRCRRRPVACAQPVVVASVREAFISSWLSGLFVPIPLAALNWLDLQ